MTKIHACFKLIQKSCAVDFPALEISSEERDILIQHFNFLLSTEEIFLIKNEMRSKTRGYVFQNLRDQLERCEQTCMTAK